MYIKELKSRKMNLPAWLLVLFVIVAKSCFVFCINIISSLVTNPEKSSCFEAIPDVNAIIQDIFIGVTLTIVLALFPVIGWLTDTIIGRERAINLSLWSCWCGILLQCISYCIQYGTCGLPTNIAKYGISSVALLLVTIGSVGLITNIPAYGLDQLRDKPNTHARAFVHWIVWGYVLGKAIGTESSNDFKFLLITGIMTFLFISVALCLHVCFYNYYELVGTQKNNPYKIVYNVLKYALYHKSPENRSAFTYWENEIPSRVDLGKSKYGGPFSEEDVENVKTFWRIVAVLLSTFGLFIPYYHVAIDVTRYINTFEGATTALNGHGSTALWLGLESQIIILVPLFELVIIPLFPKIEYFILKALRAIGVSYILILIALLCMIVLELVGHFVTPGDVVCATSLPSTGDDLVQISYLYYSIPLVFSGLAVALSQLYILEFIISQAPANMSGMIVGTFYSIRNLYINIGGIFIYWNIHGPGRISCSFWVLLIQVVICIIGMIIYMYVARWYRRRRKDEDYEVHAVIKATYDRIFESRQEEQYPESTYTVIDVN